MDIQSLKLELVQRLMNTSDVGLLEAVRRILGVGTKAGELAGTTTGPAPDEDRERWLTAGARNLARSYGADEPDIGSLELKEPKTA